VTIVWLVIAAVMCVSAAVLLVGSYRRRSPLGPLVALMLLLLAGFPAIVYGALSS